jgi:hypothetical protein
MLTPTLRRLARGGSIPITAATLLACSCLSRAAAQQGPPPPPVPLATATAAPLGVAPATPRGGAIVISRRVIAGRSRLSDVLAGVATLRIIRMGAAGSIVTSGRTPGCVPELFIDRLRVAGQGSGPFDVDLIPVGSVEQIEIYPGLGSVPLDVAVRDARCGVVIVRTSTR